MNFINQEKAVHLLTELKEQVPALQSKLRFSPEFKVWKRNAEMTIERIFGEDKRHIKDFKEIIYNQTWGNENNYQKQYVEGLDHASKMIDSLINELNTFGLCYDSGLSESTDTLKIIENICNKFHKVVRQLKVRHADRNTISIEDEYDVQDLFHSLLHLHFEDIRPEEWTPSYAGGASRMDFLLKAEKTIIEIKKTRSSLTAKMIGEQLIIDTERYFNSHPDCKTLVCFVYDPEARIGNPKGLENDLTKESERGKTIIIISPK